jgi:CubicO group peptidase (beta-lactamase class C family)
MRGFIPLLFYLLTLFTGQAQAGAEAGEELTRRLEDLNRKGPLVGFAVALVDEGGISYARGFGYAEKAGERRYQKSTLQNIASISKTFIGLALLKAQELGHLDLDDPVNDHLPFTVIHPRYPDHPITLRHLATHTSGITDPPEYDTKGYVLRKADNGQDVVNSDFRPPEEMMPLEEYQQRILSKRGAWYRKKTFLKYKPGARFEYSNIGAGLAALALEQATGIPFNEFTRAHIFGPLQMSDTGWFPEEVPYSRHTRLYTDTGAPLAPYSLVNYPDGGLITSAEDLGKYLSELIRGYVGKGTLLNPEGYRELFTPRLKDSNFEERSENTYNDEYNMGVFMGFSARGQVGHTGGDPGTATMMFFNAETRKGKLLIVNTDLDEAGYEEFKAIWGVLEEFENRF